MCTGLVFQQAEAKSGRGTLIKAENVSGLARRGMLLARRGLSLCSSIGSGDLGGPRTATSGGTSGPCKHDQTHVGGSGQRYHRGNLHPDGTSIMRNQHLFFIS